jgi:tetratricopeptide (TPR) repeat protein
MKCAFAIILFFLTLTSVAQTSEKYNSPYADFYRGEELFQKQQYAAARIELRRFIDQYQQSDDPMYIKALFYEGLSALELFNNDAVSLLTNFNRNYPESIYKNQIAFKLGRYFYQKKDFSEALVWFTKLRTQDVEQEDRDEYLFKLGYANFQEKHYTEARSAFHDVKDGSSPYAAPGLYYFSHIAYMDKSYQIALDGFLKLQSSESFGRMAPYYISQIYYLQGKYKEVTEYAPTILDTANVFNKNDMNHLIGDAFYRISKFDEAVPYLQEYYEKANTTREDEYVLGYAYYRSGQYEKAIKLFDKVSREKDSLGQTAYYHAGECYLKLNKLVPARSAFEAAAKTQGDPVLQEDAQYHYAVLSYKLDINPYDEAVIALEDYLRKYPNSLRKSDVNQYLVNVYTTTNNYEKALASLDKIPQKDTKLKAAYQLVAFNQGVKFFQEANYTKALNSFELSEKYPMDPEITVKNKFWSADAYFRNGKTDPAIKLFKEVVALPLAGELKADAYYNLGYAYLKKQEVDLSIEAFRMYVQSPVKNKSKLADGFMRAADGYYMTKQNENAIRHYQSALDLHAGFEDQALYYMAKTYGFSDKTQEKITRLLDIVNNYPTSRYVLQSVYEVAISYKAISELDKAKRYFEQVVTDYPNSDLVVSSKIEIADIYYKKWEYAKAENDYKSILSAYGEDRKVCEKAVRGLVDVYAALKQPEKATDLASQYACANISTEEQEGLFYSPAIEAYRDSSFSTAIPLFEKYVEKFPSGRYRIDALYYLAESYFATAQKDKAMEYYRKLLELSNNSYTEFAASRASQYFYNKGDFEASIPFYERLETTSSKPAVIFNAKLGLMRSNFKIENWTNAAQYANQVLQSSQVTNTTRLEAEYANGMSNFYLNNFDLARTSLEWVIKNTTTAWAAEAKYSLAEAAFKMQQLDKADAEIRALLKMKPAYNYWIAKGLILQTRVLIGKDDLFQAEQTLKSVIDNYPDKEDGIISEANELWDELMQLKNPPKTVVKEQENVIEVKEGGN